MAFIQIRSIGNLKYIAQDRWVECRIILGGGGFYSLKDIIWDKKHNIFEIYHHIDNTNEELDQYQMEKTNVAKAINLGALVYDDQQEFIPMFNVEDDELSVQT